MPMLAPPWAQVLREVGEAIDEAEGRMRRLEGRFRVFKHDMHWRQQREEAAALQLCRMEGALFDALADGVTDLFPSLM